MVFRFLFTVPNLELYQDIDSDTYDRALNFFNKQGKCDIKQVVNMTTGEIIYTSTDFEGKNGK